ncbi:ABC transporter permease [Pseudactinotalea terrae]|uniref:ABC transporter permease n=1 Tax=Pseudactinotalea terrae TaxID=1743262 RepID=UPI0012E114CA|nr:ABC transporter permease [Pseudactinotalea terrae]
MRLRLLLRQATSSIGASIAIMVIVAVAAGLFTAWPRLSRATFADEVTFQMAQTNANARALTGTALGWPVGAFDTSTTYAAALDAVEGVVDEAGPMLRPNLGDPELLISVGMPPVNPTGTGMPFDAPTPRPADLAGRFFELRAIDSLLEHATIVAGTEPAAWPGLQLDASGDGSTAPATQIEVMFSVHTAQRLGVSVGDELSGWPSPEAPASPEAAEPVVAVVTGLFEATDQDEEYWQFQVSGLTPRIASDPNAGDFAIGAAYVHPDTAQALSSSALRPTTSVWIPVAVGTGDVAGLLDDLRDVTARNIPLGESGFGGGLQMRLGSQLIDVLDRAITSQRGTSAVLTLVAAGPVGVTFALLALGTRLSVSRRRATLALANARGGSPWQIRGALAAEGLVLGVPAALLGAAAATVLVPESFQLGDYGLPALAALAPAVLLASEKLPSLRTQRADISTRSSSRWRWVAEVLLVAIAGGAVYLLLSRGLQATTTTTVDPLTTATPLLISLAAAVLATRLFPFPMRLVHAAARRGRGLAAFLGSARAIRESGGGLVPMLALLVGTSIAIFSTAMLSTLSTGVGEATLAANGAEMRLAGPPYSDEVVAEIEGVEGVAATARVFAEPQTALTAGESTRQATLYAVDTATLGIVQTGVTGALALPAGMAALEGEAIPIVLSSALLPEEDGLDLSVRIGSLVPVTQVGTAAAAAGFAEGPLWAVVDLELLREVTGQNLVPRLLLVDLEPDADVDAVTTEVSRIVGGIGTIATSSGQQSAFLSSPSAISMQVGFVVALVVSVLQSVLALVLTLVLAAPERGRLVAVLRTLGIGARDSRRLVSWELVPLGIVALVVGTVLGLALPHLVVATVDLSPFTGQSSPPVVYDGGRLALVLAGVLAILGLTLLVASAVARRLSLSVLRIGDAT